MKTRIIFSNLPAMRLAGYNHKVFNGWVVPLPSVVRVYSFEISKL